MPKPIARSSPRHALSIRMLLKLSRGQDWWFLEPGLGGRTRFADQEVRQAWAVIGAELTSLHIRHHPGSRPWGWWAFDRNAPDLWQEFDEEMMGTQLEYLTRHQLLQRGELTAVKRLPPHDPAYDVEWTPSLQWEVLHAWHQAEE